jgi:F420-0:gamma-glutamyl ligase-like protein
MFATNFCNISGTGVAQIPESAKRLAEEMEKTLQEEQANGGPAKH